MWGEAGDDNLVLTSAGNIGQVDGGSGFDTQRRAEEVPVAEYVALAQAVSGQP